MKTILIPTDFTSASLQLIEETIRCFRPEPVNIVLFHAFEMPASMQDVVGSDDKPHLHVMHERFRRGCKRIKNKYGTMVYNIGFRHMYGSTAQVFRHYLQFNKIDAIVYPDGYGFHAIHKRSVNPDKMIRKCKYPIITSLTPEKFTALTSVIDERGNLLLSEMVPAS